MAAPWFSHWRRQTGECVRKDSKERMGETHRVGKAAHTKSCPGLLTVSPRGRHIHLHPTVASKGHFQQAGDEASITDVMA